MLVLILLSACSGEAPPVSLDLFASSPTCTSSSGDGRLDLVLGCADGACAEGTYDEWAEALGGPGECSQSSPGASVRCAWAQGVHGYFDDDDADTLPDPGNAAGMAFITPPFDGLTEDGLGLGVSLRCFLERLGDPESVHLELVDGAYAPVGVSFDQPDIDIEDEEGPGGDAVPDGLADGLDLRGL